MSNIVIYKEDNGNIAFLMPTPEALKDHTLLEIADKDVPSGKPYKIIDNSELPDLEFYYAWELDDSVLTDGVGADRNTF